MAEEKVHRFNEAGRMLLAAVKAYQLGNRSIDYTLKKYVPEVVPRQWADLAESLLRGMHEELGNELAPPKPDSTIH